MRWRNSASSTFAPDLRLRPTFATAVLTSISLAGESSSSAGGSWCPRDLAMSISGQFSLPDSDSTLSPSNINATGQQHLRRESASNVRLRYEILGYFLG